MKILGFLLLLFLSASAWAQNPTIQDCLGAIPVCQDAFVQDTGFEGDGNIDNEINAAISGCFVNGEQNSVWYIFTVLEDGILNFVLTPTEIEDDFDWALFNLTGATCSDIGTNGDLLVSCNTWGAFGENGSTGISTSLGGEGNSNGPGGDNGPPFNEDLIVSEGETFVLLVNDWSASELGYTLDFSASTANIFDATPPEIVDATFNCEGDLLVTFSENVTCESIIQAVWELSGTGSGVSTATGIVSACNGGQATFTNTIALSFDQLPFTQGDTYFLFSQNPFLDLCGNASTGNQFEFEGTVGLNFDIEIGAVDCFSGLGSISVENIAGGEAPFVVQVNGVAQAGFSINNIAAGTQEITVLDALGCSSSQSITIAATNAPTLVNAQVSPAACATVCDGRIQFDVLNTDQIEMVSSGALASNLGFSGLCAGGYDFILSNASGCETIAAVEVTIAPVVVASVFANPNVVSTEDPKFEVYTTTENIATFAWALGAAQTPIGDNTNGFFYTIEDPTPGTFTIALEGVLENGCRTFGETKVSVAAPFYVYIPNSFTPDADGLNDVFTLSLAGIQDHTFEIEIMNRWGETVYKSNNPSEPWRGEHLRGDHFVQSGIYLYKMSVLPLFAVDKQVFEGQIQVIR